MANGKTVSESHLLRTLLNLWPYMWPAGRADLKMRVVWASVYLLISKFVLLDHMDWMASHYPQALVEEWREILARAAPSARIIFRSAHSRPKYLDTISVDGVKLTEHLRFHESLARELSRQDRVHTYAGFHICDVPA